LGEQLARRALEEARQMGATKVTLETNSKLIPAINLYKKLGFTEVTLKASKYGRVDVVMELSIE
jgi:putative acetyltransferase